MPSTASPHRILFVCLGNICRSPAAEIIFRHVVKAEGREEDFKIDSAGTIDYHQGNPPDARMSATLKDKGYTIAGQSRIILTSDLDDFDLIVTMDECNLEEVQAMVSSDEQKTKIRPFVSFLQNMDAPRIPDPYHGGQKGFEEVIELLEDGCEGILKELPSSE